MVFCGSSVCGVCKHLKFCTIPLTLEVHKVHQMVHQGAPFWNSPKKRSFFSSWKPQISAGASTIRENNEIYQWNLFSKSSTSPLLDRRHHCFELWIWISPQSAINWRKRSNTRLKRFDPCCRNSHSGTTMRLHLPLELRVNFFGDCSTGKSTLLNA